MSFLPRYFRRRVLLARARELLAAGDPRGALAILSDPIFAGSPVAADLRRAAELHLASLPVDGPSAAIRDLLARMRAEKLARAGTGARGEAAVAGASRASPGDSPASDARETPRARRLARLRLAVDDAGEYLVVVGEDVVLGHAASRRADLGFLADVEGEHARLLLVTDLAGGARWHLIPLGPARLTVAGRTVDVGGTTLKDGDAVTLAPNVSFRFRASDPASASAVLELHHGLECFGAPRVLLIVPGPHGRVRIGAPAARLVRVASLDADVSLEVVPAVPNGAGARFSVACPGGIGRGARPRGDGDSSVVDSSDVALPPRAPERFTLGARPKDRAPFEVVLWDADDERDVTS